MATTWEVVITLRECLTIYLDENAFETNKNPSPPPLSQCGLKF